MPIIQTQRLILRPWQTRDHLAFAELNADPEVMRFFPKTLSSQESASLLEYIDNHLTSHGWGIWAVELKQTQSFIGCVGLHKTSATLPFPPSIEILWRLAKDYWGFGYATEAARAVMSVGFDSLSLAEIIAFTALVNKPSQAVMERLAMQRDENTFEHPSLVEGHPLRSHCLYRMARTAWLL
ncbi:GNAT family N-acetyltransferase [Thiolinea disciformis]|uniref:GNAT family N-acetyltransferase n=1 Tax=Thiolinea disciformis TaxID=125614 RepID=UPI00037CA2D7|nr:GNAT family N-acetyltransferase [Thiolinea disciformis]